MAKYSYKAIDENGKEVSGMVEAENESDALNDIGRGGLYVTSIHVAHVGDFLRSRWNQQKALKEQYQHQKRQEVRKKHARQRLVVHYRDGRTEYGICLALNPKEAGFHLDRMSVDEVSTGETMHVRYQDLKAVFHVKSFDGKHAADQRFAQFQPEGQEVIVTFQDGESIRGFTLQNYSPDDPRFTLIPADPKSNNLSILIEVTSVERVYTIEEYEAARAQKREASKKEDVSTDFSHEETMGDFYAETRNWTSAHEQYRAAVRANPQSRRLRKKLLLAEYNIGVQYIKRREYPQALACMEKILATDPHNAHAKKKVLQLRRIIQKSERDKDGPPNTRTM